MRGKEREGGEKRKEKREEKEKEKKEKRKKKEKKTSLKITRNRNFLNNIKNKFTTNQRDR